MTDPLDADPIAANPINEREYRRRQRRRATVTALILGAFVVLFYFITIAKIGAAQ